MFSVGCCRYEILTDQTLCPLDLGLFSGVMSGLLKDYVAEPTITKIFKFLGRKGLDWFTTSEPEAEISNLQQRLLYRLLQRCETELEEQIFQATGQASPERPAEGNRHLQYIRQRQTEVKQKIDNADFITRAAGKAGEVLARMKRYALLWQLPKRSSLDCFVGLLS